MARRAESCYLIRPDGERLRPRLPAAAAHRREASLLVLGGFIVAVAVIVVGTAGQLVLLIDLAREPIGLVLDVRRDLRQLQRRGVLGEVLVVRAGDTVHPLVGLELVPRVGAAAHLLEGLQGLLSHHAGCARAVRLVLVRLGRLDILALLEVGAGVEVARRHVDPFEVARHSRLCAHGAHGDPVGALAVVGHPLCRPLDGADDDGVRGQLGVHGQRYALLVGPHALLLLPGVHPPAVIAARALAPELPGPADVVAVLLAELPVLPPAPVAARAGALLREGPAEVVACGAGLVAGGRLHHHHHHVARVEVGKALRRCLIT
mmetsp:Transcript_7501/g.16004  ORF Transcript_7501/g.16004 Transcript_7501/m.16004 type:complete len:319 (+) Transcript_7501:865-1821(+)